MKIVLAAAPVKTGAVAYNTAAMVQTLRECRGAAELVVFGESVLQGFDALTWDYETDRTIAVTQEGAEIMALRDAAKSHNVALSFGYIERDGDALFSSQIVIDAAGAVIHNFRRVSVGWKEFTKTDAHYREGDRFEKFRYGGKTLAIGLCGDLWTEGRPEEMMALNADVVLWPVWCDYKAGEWNTSTKYEYAEQAALCGACVLLVNPFCTDPGVTDAAAGGAACFKNGSIVAELPSGQSGYLTVEV